jgi:hypothetical protein
MEGLKIITERVDGAKGQYCGLHNGPLATQKIPPSQGRKPHSTKKVFEKKEKKHIV